jgi:sigma54-dependent transcription regulator
MRLMNYFQTKLAAQSRLLEDATRQVFLLETQIKETAHKVDRLRDYEKRIDQLTATQRLW